MSIAKNTRRWVADWRAVLAQRRRPVAFHNWWPHPRPEELWFHRFLQRPRLRATFAGRRVAFFSVFGRRRVARLSGADVKVFFTGENTDFYPHYADHLGGLADLSLGFDPAVPGANYLRFPLWVCDFVPPLATPDDVRTLLESTEQVGRDLAERPGFAALVARHDRDGMRKKLHGLLGHYGPVDVHGPLGNRPPISRSAKDELLRGYRLNCCPENSDRPGYVTEKLFDAIQAGCVPVYRGGGGLAEPEVLNQKAILWYESEEQWARSQGPKILESPAALIDFSRQRRFAPTASAWISDRVRQLEDRLLALE